MRSLWKNLISLVSLLWVLVNLTFWFVPLLLLTLVRPFLPASTISGSYARLIGIIYRCAAAVDSFWMLHVIGVNIVVHGKLPGHPSPIVICNHQTWFDIPVLQEVVCANGPILKFLIKRELAFVPIIGWICVALNFPRLYRGRGKASTSSDYNRIREASVELSNEPGALLIFPEGTRFTQAKRIAQQSPFANLLTPRTGGLRILKESAAGDMPLVDVTIVYDNADANFWTALSGAIGRVDVYLHQTTLADIDDVEAWLMDSWAQKDQWLNG